MKILKITLLAFLLSPLPLLADGGKVIFVYGKAEVVSPNGVVTAIERGSSIESGDRILTGATGRVQVRMDDGGLIALRPLTEFSIDQFRFPKVASEKPEDQPRSFFSLIKGGFRSVTGAIGRENKDDYRVDTPVATIGIRGTDYIAYYCVDRCQDDGFGNSGVMGAGLFLSVNEGGVVISNDAGKVELGVGDSGFVSSAKNVPEQTETSGSSAASANQGEVVVADSDGGTPLALEAQSDGGQVVNLTSGDNPGDLIEGPVAATTPSGIKTAVAIAAEIQLDQASQIVVINMGPELTVINNDASVADGGSDMDRNNATDLMWGRWAGGSVSVVTAGQSETVSLNDSSVHWVAGSDNAVPALPSTGSASFTLIGNTNPTDNRGNTGTLGEANLTADFVRQTVDASLTLSIAETSELWEASANDLDISEDATFGGEFDQVSITQGQTVADGSGQLDGFFSADPVTGELGGAGVSYQLEDGQGAEVSGAAAFEVDN